MEKWPLFRWLHWHLPHFLNQSSGQQSEQRRGWTSNNSHFTSNACMLLFLSMPGFSSLLSHWKIAEKGRVRNEANGWRKSAMNRLLRIARASLTFDFDLTQSVRRRSQKKNKQIWGQSFPGTGRQRDREIIYTPGRRQRGLWQLLQLYATEVSMPTRKGNMERNGIPLLWWKWTNARKKDSRIMMIEISIDWSIRAIVLPMSDDFTELTRGKRRPNNKVLY